MSLIPQKIFGIFWVFEGLRFAGDTPAGPTARMVVLRKKAVVLALQNDLRVLLVVPLWLS